jgi:hypothetical protein
VVFVFGTREWLWRLVFVSGFQDWLGVEGFEMTLAFGGFSMRLAFGGDLHAWQSFVIARWTHYAWTRSASHSCMRSLKLGCPILLPVSHMPSPASTVIELFVGLIITMELDVIWRWFCTSNVVGREGGSIQREVARKEVGGCEALELRPASRGGA